MVGAHIGAGQAFARTGPRPAGFGYGEQSTSSDELAVNAARREMMAMYNAMPGVFEQNLIDRAVQIFRLARGLQFVQGRSIQVVAAVSLYIAARQNPTRNRMMLIDVAEQIKMNIFSLGKTYTDLCKELSQDRVDESWKNEVNLAGKVEQMNPENLIRRFATDLEFGDQTEHVAQDAIILVRRMDRDWMTTGRRPAGICGAALVLAARMNNFRRTVREVVYTVKVCEITVGQRLAEFQHLDASNLTVHNFRTHDFSTIPACDPPSFYNQGKEKKTKGKNRGRPRKGAPESAAELEGGEESNKENESNQDEEDNAEDDEADERPSKRQRIDQDGFAIPNLPASQMPRVSTPSSIKPSRNTRSSHTAASPSPTANDDDDDDTMSVVSENGTRRRIGRPKGSKNWVAPPKSRAEEALEAEIEGDINEVLEGRYGRPDLVLARERSMSTEPQTPPPTQMQRQTRSQTSQAESSKVGAVESQSQTLLYQPSGITAETLQAIATGAPLPTPQPTQEHEKGTDPAIDPALISSSPTSSTAPSPPTPVVPNDGHSTPESSRREIPMTEEIGEWEFDSDPEVRLCHLTPLEIEIKEKIWVSENADWLRQDHAKRIKRHLEDAARKDRGEMDSDGNLTEKGRQVDRENARGKGKGKKGKRKRRRIGDVGYLDEMDEERARQERAASGEGGDNAEGIEGQENGDEPPKPKRKRTAADSIMAMMGQRGLNTKANSNVLSTLYPELFGSQSPTTGSRSPSASAAGSRPGSIARSRSRSASVASMTSAASASVGTAAGTGAGVKKTYKRRPMTDEQKMRRNELANIRSAKRKQEQQAEKEMMEKENDGANIGEAAALPSTSTSPPMSTAAPAAAPASVPAETRTSLTEATGALGENADADEGEEEVIGTIDESEEVIGIVADDEDADEGEEGDEDDVDEDEDGIDLAFHGEYPTRQDQYDDDSDEDDN